MATGFGKMAGKPDRKVMGQELKEWGYELSNVDATIPIGERLKYFKGLVSYRMNRWFVLGLDWFLSLFYPWPLSYKTSSNSGT